MTHSPPVNVVTQHLFNFHGVVAGWLIQRCHRYYLKFPELYSRRINLLKITALSIWLNSKVWNKLPFWILISEFWYISLFQNLFPPFWSIILSRDTVSFFLKFFLSIWNFLISGNFLKSGISVNCFLTCCFHNVWVYNSSRFEGMSNICSGDNCSCGKP